MSVQCIAAVVKGGILDENVVLRKTLSGDP